MRPLPHNKPFYTLYFSIAFFAAFVNSLFRIFYSSGLVLSSRGKKGSAQNAALLLIFFSFTVFD
jgi:hypothetical protein